MANSGAALSRANAALAVVAAGKTFTVANARPGVDAYAAIMVAINACKANGGGTVFLPFIGGYTVSAPIVVAFNNCTILLDDDVTFTMTNPTVLVGPNAPYQSGVTGAAIVGFMFAGLIAAGSPVGNRYYVANPALIGRRRVTITMNAQNVAGYTYVAGASGDHHAVFFNGTTDALCTNITVRNGLAGGITAAYSPRILIDRCTAIGTLHDNGIMVSFNQEHLTAFSDTDPTTWNNGTIRDCVGIACRNHGIDTFGAVGVTLINPRVISCGNNTPYLVGGVVADAGAAGGLGIEQDPSNFIRNMRVTVMNPVVDNCYGNAVHVVCNGTRFIGGRISNTRFPTNYAYTGNTTLGSNILVQGASTLELVGTDVEGAAQYGILALGVGTSYPSIHVRGGKWSGNGAAPAPNGAGYVASGAIYAAGLAELTVSADTLFEANGNTVDTATGVQYTIYITNSAANPDQGLAQIAGRFQANNGGVLYAARIGNLDLSQGIKGMGNGAAWASSNKMIFVPDKVTSLQVGNINLMTGGNGKASQLIDIVTATNVYADQRSIVGDYAISAYPPLHIEGGVVSYAGNTPDNTVRVSYAATFTPNSANGHHLFASPYLTGNMTMAADAPSTPAQPGQVLQFILIQDATGGRAVTWNAAWKGATLTSAGTANQRAQVVFRYDANAWAQVSNTGWYS